MAGALSVPVTTSASSLFLPTKKQRTIDGRNYYTFEYDLTSTNFSRTAFATISIGNGRYYTLIVGALGRRWKKTKEPTQSGGRLFQGI